MVDMYTFVTVHRSKHQNENMQMNTFRTVHIFQKNVKYYFTQRAKSEAE